MALGASGAAGQLFRAGPRKRDMPFDANEAPKWWQTRVSYNSPGLVGVAATTGNVDFKGIPEGSIIHGAFFRLITEFSGGSVSAITASIGSTGSPAAYATAANVFTGAGAPLTKAGVSLAPGTFLATPTGTGTLRVQFLSTSDNVGSLTAGQLDVYVLISTVEMYFGG